MNGGVFTARVWPTHVGVWDVTGAEPWWYLDYRRAQIAWEERVGRLCGRAIWPLLVPAGEYTHLAFFHHPKSPLLIAVKALQHPLRFHDESQVDVHGIIEEDVLPRTEIGVRRE